MLSTIHVSSGGSSRHRLSRGARSERATTVLGCAGIADRADVRTGEADLTPHTASIGRAGKPSCQQTQTVTRKFATALLLINTCNNRDTYPAESESI